MAHYHYANIVFAGVLELAVSDLQAGPIFRSTQPVLKIRPRVVSCRPPHRLLLVCFRRCELMAHQHYAILGFFLQVSLELAANPLTAKGSGSPGQKDGNV